MPLPVYRFGDGEALYQYVNGQYVRITPEQMKPLWDQNAGLVETKIPGVPPAPGFGVQSGGFVPTDVMDSAFPYTQLPVNTALTLAQLQNQKDIADKQAWAAVFGDQIRAGATVQAAAAAANAQVQSQKIQTGGMLQATQGQLTNQANISNQSTAMQLAQMAGSGQLRDSIANRLALRGFGQMPGIGSALNGVQDRIWVNAPNIGGVGGGGSTGGGSGGGGSFGGGGGFAGGASFGGSMPSGGGSIADLYNSIFAGIKPSFQGKVFGYDPPATGAVGNQDPFGKPFLLPGETAANGGTFGVGSSILVGDSRSGKPTGYEEVVTVRPGGVEVTPLAGRAATGGTLGTGGMPAGTQLMGGDVLIPTPEPYPGYDAAKQASLAASRAPVAFGMSSPNFGFASPGSSPGNISSPSWNVRPRPGESQGGSGLNFGDIRKKIFGALGGPGLTGDRMGTQPVGGIQPVGGALPLSDVNQIPALLQARTGNVFPAFGMGPQSFSEPSLGVTNTPAPYKVASTFGQMSPYEQEDLLQMWEFLGMPRQVAAYQMAEATPGFRRNPVQSFSF